MLISITNAQLVETLKNYPLGKEHIGYIPKNVTIKENKKRETISVSVLSKPFKKVNQELVDLYKKEKSLLEKSFNFPYIKNDLDAPLVSYFFEDIIYIIQIKKILKVHYIIISHERI